MATILKILLTMAVATVSTQAATVWTNSFANVVVRTNLTAAGEAVNTNNYTKRTLLTSTSNALASATAAKLDATRAAVTNAIGVSIDGSGNIVTPGSVTATTGASVNAELTADRASVTNAFRVGLTTNWAAHSAVTNYVVDLSKPSLTLNITNAVNLIHSTNGTANFATGFSQSGEIELINASGGNLTVAWPATWKTVGTYGSGFTLTNGDHCLMAVRFIGRSTSQTNNTVAVAYEKF